MTEGLIGLRGTLTIGTRGPDGPGEVLVRTENGTKQLIAYSDHPIPRHAVVVIYEDRGGMRVDVEPLTNSDGEG